MPRFFPSHEVATKAREVYKTGTIAEALLEFDGEPIEQPRTRDWHEMIEEFCSLMESLGVPDRDGADLAVIVPVFWAGSSCKRSISLDIGRRALAFARQPDTGPGTVTDEVFTEDPELAKNLRDALMPALVSYKNKRPLAD